MQAQLTQSKELGPTLKVVGSSGQISLGKEYAGQQVQVEMREPGVWLVRTVVVVPTNELWLHVPATADALNRAVTWSLAHPPRESDLSELIGVVENGKPPTEEKPGKTSARVGAGKARSGRAGRG